MNAYTTLKITRGKALDLMLQYVYDLKISDGELTEVLDSYLESSLHKTKLVPDGQANDNVHLVLRDII